MPRLDALDDFMLRTLSLVPGRWQKLVYIAGLRRPNRHGYRHWGMARLYGAEATDLALARVHSRVFIDVLCAPISDLSMEICSAAEEDPGALAVWLEQQRARAAALLPQDLDGGTRPHFNSMLDCLCRLARARSAATGPGASRSRSPAL